MLSGHAISYNDINNEADCPSSGPASDIDEVDEEVEMFGKILYRASFEELKRSYLKYDTVIWILISLPLVLAWGIGLLLLLYLPIRRWMLGKDISSRKLYVTDREIVYKVMKPSFLPFPRLKKLENRIPLYMVIDIVVEQGCLQSVYGIHTVRIENISHGKAAPLDELHIQGVLNPGLLRKVIVAEASKSIQEVGNHRSTKYTVEGDSVRVGSRAMVTPKRHVPSVVKANTYAPQIPDLGSTVSTGVVLNKLEEVKLSIKNIEQFVAGQHSPIEIKES